MPPATTPIGPEVGENLLALDTGWTSLPARLFVFDLDDTLAPSKSPLPAPMSAALTALLQRAPVAIISGGRFEQFQSQVIDRLALSPMAAARLHLLPTCGTSYYRWIGGAWTRIYFEALEPADKELIQRVLLDGARTLGLLESVTWGEIIDDRGSQITFSALGQAAPVEAKVQWDPDGTKKSRLRAYAAPRLPNFEVRSGGSTSIDVTRQGIDKAYGIRKLVSVTGIPIPSLLFVGDRLDVDGNDYPVLHLGVRCVQVRSWHDTVALVERLAALPEGSSRTT